MSENIKGDIFIGAGVVAIGGDINGSSVDDAVNRAIHFDQAWRTERANSDYACTNKKIAFDVFTHEIPQKVDFAPLV